MTGTREPTASPPWEDFVEPWRATAVRTGGIALGVALILGLMRGRLASVPATAVVALWFTLGGHFLEVFFRNRLRRRLRLRASTLALLRVLWWFVGGSVLALGALGTWAVLHSGETPRVRWWMGGLGFVLAELLAHLVLRARGLANFYDGRG